MLFFQERVYKVVSKIPKGRVLSYAEVARLAGSPLAWRAVGNILNKNSDTKKVPCHRVIKSDGRVGGYRWGAKNKTALLKREGAKLKEGRIF